MGAPLLAFVLGAVLMLSEGDSVVPQSRVRRVIGGTKIKDGEWPWLVHMRGKFPHQYFWGIPINYKKVYCGASLLNEFWVLTAAHCILAHGIGRANALNPRNYRLQLGDSSRKLSFTDKVRGFWGKLLRIKKWRNWQISAKKIIIHPGYDGGNGWLHDLALIKLKEPMPTGHEVPEIRDVKLPTQGDRSFPTDNQECVMKGWGCTKHGGGATKNARATILPIVNDATCSGTFGGLDMKTRLCAGHFNKGKGICSGDSGGPLVCKNIQGDWVQVGVAHLASENKPGVFTRTSYYINWIRDTMRRN